ncbi:MAG: exonuclease SbcCD subunit D [Candidatus Dependentiae bacterium]|nr:exonuclease SbcCD subunit D [Candidatus Dependentiae bacterium]
MIRFIHTADVHFGMENYGKIDPETGIHSRLLDFERAFNACIDTAIKEEVDFLLFCGDAYKTTNPSPTQQKLMLKCLLRLYKANIPAVIIVGNHDNPLSFGKASSLDIFGDLPLEGFYVIDQPTTLVLQTKGGPVQIVGMPWPTRNTIALSTKHIFKNAIEITSYISQAVSHIIQDHAKKLDPTLPAVFGAHMTVSSGIFSGSEKRAIYGNDPVLLPSQLAIAPFDYIALGHLHRYQNLNPNGVPIVYSGSIERIDFGERKEDKGFCLVTIESKEKTTYEFIKTPMRPFIQIEVDLNAERNQTDQILDAIRAHNVNDAVVKILYHLTADRKDFVDLKVIQKALAGAMYVVGIIPIRPVAVRERRATMQVTMDLPTLLDTYFSAKAELKDKKDDLIKKTILLFEESKEKSEEAL